MFAQMWNDLWTNLVALFSFGWKITRMLMKYSLGLAAVFSLGLMYEMEISVMEFPLYFAISTVLLGAIFSNAVFGIACWYKLLKDEFKTQS